MPIKNTPSTFGWVAVLNHWLAALTIFGLFGLGWWMVQLGYYSEWYRTAPFIHKSVGLCLFALMIFRLVWRMLNVQPKALGKPIEIKLGAFMHFALYAIIFAVMISGYLISTADGSAISVFDWFSIPAIIYDIDNQEDIAGEIHEWLAWTLVIAALLHAVAALKHHFFDKDKTLIRMFGKQ